MPLSARQKKARKAQLIQEYGSRCWHCGENLPPEKLTLDHLKPKSKGGSNSLENLRLACLPCNRNRGNSLYPPDYVLQKRKANKIAMNPAPC